METPNKVEDVHARIVRPPAAIVPRGMCVYFTVIYVASDSFRLLSSHLNVVAVPF